MTLYKVLVHTSGLNAGDIFEADQEDLDETLERAILGGVVIEFHDKPNKTEEAAEKSIRQDGEDASGVDDTDSESEG